MLERAEENMSVLKGVFTNFKRGCWIIFNVFYCKYDFTFSKIIISNMKKIFNLRTFVSKITRFIYYVFAYKPFKYEHFGSKILDFLSVLSTIIRNETV